MAIKLTVIMLIIFLSALSQEKRPFGKLIPFPMYAHGDKSLVMPYVPSSYSFRVGFWLTSSFVEYYKDDIYSPIEESLISLFLANNRISVKGSVSVLNADPYRESSLYFSFGIGKYEKFRIGADCKIEYVKLLLENMPWRLNFIPSVSSAINLKYINMVLSAGNVSLDIFENRDDFVQDLLIVFGFVSHVEKLGSASIVLSSKPLAQNQYFSVLLSGSVDVNKYISIFTALRSLPYIIDFGITLRFLKRLNFSLSSVIDPNLGGSFILGYFVELQ